MKLAIRERRLGEIPAGALLMLPLFFLPLGAYLVGSGALNLGTCGFKVIMGLPCLTCGSTRATMYLFQGNVLEALHHQPMMMLIYMVLTSWGLVSLWAFFARKSVRLKLTDRQDLLLKIALVGIPLSNWTYLVFAGI